MGYFAARSAPLGIVPPEVVTAVFYNFAPERVTKALPAAWQIAGPEAALRVRQDSAVAALRRYGLGADENVGFAAGLAGRAAREATLDGRPLFAANRALPWPDDPLAALWHAATLLREQRGDAHVAVLTAEGVRGRESNVLHASAGAVPREYIARTRDYDEATWRHHEQRLAERGLLNADGSPTAAGRELKDRIASQTDALSLSALDALSDDEVEALFQALTPIARAVIAGGDLPVATPMNLRRNELHDGSAHLADRECAGTPAVPVDGGANRSEAALGSAGWLGVRPVLDLGGDGVGDVVEFGMLLEHCADHGTHRDNSFAVGTGGIQRLFEENRRQASSAEVRIDHGVVENALVTAVGVVRVADGLAVDGDGVRLVLGGDCGSCAGLVGRHSEALPVDSFVSRRSFATSSCAPISRQYRGASAESRRLLKNPASSKTLDSEESRWSGGRPRTNLRGWQMQHHGGRRNCLVFAARQ